MRHIKRTQKLICDAYIKDITEYLNSIAPNTKSDEKDAVYTLKKNTAYQLQYLD